MKTLQFVKWLYGILPNSMKVSVRKGMIKGLTQSLAKDVIDHYKDPTETAVALIVIDIQSGIGLSEEDIREVLTGVGINEPEIQKTLSIFSDNNTKLRSIVGKDSTVEQCFSVLLKNEQFIGIRDAIGDQFS